MNTAAVLAILTVLGEITSTVIKSQPPDVQKTMWERHIAVTQPFYDLLIKLENKIDPSKQ